jgi:hypothetical protein
MKSKKIEFRPRTPQFDILEPKPASLFIPDWYKKTPPVTQNILTAKRCVPIIDALSAGYIIPLPVDIEWNEESEVKKWLSNSKIDIISEHSQAQTEMFEIDSSFDTQPHKWINSWHITTPKGYSTLFVHPVNRSDLPFYSFTGFVDTDKHPVIVNFPFVIKKGFVGTIQAGTPLIQAIPIKRDDWEMSIKDEDKAYSYLKEYEVMNPPFSWYKRKFWTKKKYQ